MAALTVDDLVALWKRFVSSTWLQGKLDGAGEALARGMAAVLARASRGVDRVLNVQGHILTATGPGHATGSVQFFRTAAGGTATIPIGSVVETDDGRRFAITAAATFGVADLQSSVVGAKALFPSFEGNVEAGEITTADKSTFDPVTDAFTPGLTVTNAAAFAGGSAPVLDLHARSAGTFRQAGEPDEQLRDRIRNLPDTVTIGALRRVVNRALQPGNKQGAVDEPTPGLPPGDPAEPVQPALAQFFADAGYFADAKMTFLSDATTRGCVLVRVPGFPPTNPQALYADYLDFADALQFAEAGEPATYARYAGVVRAVNDAKAAGVLAVFEVDPTL